MRDLHLIPAYIAKALTDYPAFKWGGVILAVASEYLFGTEVVRNMGVAAFGLMFLDTITGFAAAFSTGQPISSGKLSRILVKFIAYGSAIIVAAVTTRHLPGLSTAHAAVVTAVLAIVIATEALSILENIGKMGFKRLEWLTKMLEGKLKQLEEDPLKPRPEEAEGYRPLG
jgi:phage-related holin